MIKSFEEYQSVMRRIDELLELDPAAGTPQQQELEELTDAVHTYEERNYPDFGGKRE